MPRSTRIDAPGCCTTSSAAGSRSAPSFETTRTAMTSSPGWRLWWIGEALDVYAWALLPNHFHLLCRTNRLPLSRSMHRLLTGYVVNFNKRRRRHGHLFQNRFKSIVCQEDRYLKELVRYIHLNPLRSGLVSGLSELAAYPYAGHSALAGSRRRAWQEVGRVLSFSANIPRARGGPTASSSPPA
ncbi:MAG: transposase [Desulfobacterales bacterium]|nr:transposase [Desulfobacterales bacterium]